MAIWQHLGRFLAIFSLRMRRTDFGGNFDTGIRFLDPD